MVYYRALVMLVNEDPLPVEEVPILHSLHFTSLHFCSALLCSVLFVID